MGYTASSNSTVGYDVIEFTIEEGDSNSSTPTGTASQEVNFSITIPIDTDNWYYSDETAWTQYLIKGGGKICDIYNNTFTEHISTNSAFALTLTEASLILEDSDICKFVYDDDNNQYIVYLKVSDSYTYEDLFKYMGLIDLYNDGLLYDYYGRLSDTNTGAMFTSQYLSYKPWTQDHIWVKLSDSTGPSYDFEIRTIR